MGRKKIYCFFVDFKAAFDTINRNALFHKLYNLGISTKMIRIFKSLYSDTRASVWNGELSEEFYTLSGLKQGCPGSPLLFSFFINDIEESIGGGVTLEEVHVRVLLYADDLVLLADNPDTLRMMIRNLEIYCELWSLQVNLTKSKILICSRGGGPRSERENWFFKEEAIEVVNEYKYLGVTLTPKLSFKKHLSERLFKAKTSINVTWSNFISKRSILNSTKYQIFSAVSKSIMCYGSQVWGYRFYEEVEKLQRFFLKRLLGLPQQTPNYMLNLETGLGDIYLHTLKSHLRYINRTLNLLADYRLPKILAKKIIEKNIYWYEEWNYIAGRHHLDISLENIGELINEIVDREKHFLWESKLEKARQSTRHDLYNVLDYALCGRDYFLDIHPIEMIRYIFKCRGGLLWLNASPFRTNGSPECSMCNTNEHEDTHHFIGVCPMLSEFRRLYFGASSLSAEETREILDGRDWKSLYSYAKSALKYRSFLIGEYNM